MNQLSENGRFSVLGLEGGANLTSDPAIEAVGSPGISFSWNRKIQVFLAGMESNGSYTRSQWTNK